MRISDWSSDVCSSDLQDCLSSKHGIRAPMSPGPIFFILTQYLEIDWLHRPTFDVGIIGQNSMELIGGIAGPRAPSLVERHDRAQATQEPQSAASARGLRPPPSDGGMWPRTGKITSCAPYA